MSATVEIYLLRYTLLVKTSVTQRDPQIMPPLKNTIVIFPIATLTVDIFRGFIPM
jgi:hypothetical protein